MNRGYCGIGVLNMKTEINYGTLFRSAFAFGADFIFLIGKRFRKQSSDTTQSHKHIPLFEYPTFDDFYRNIPYDCCLISVEICERAKLIRIFSHPERAVYLLGKEDGSLPDDVINKSFGVIKIPTTYCLNVAVAGSIILFDRFNKMK
jgi:tRNA(Leu) C34 or U34 (ribose-2'-O)-methylase TrmL